MVLDFLNWICNQQTALMAAITIFMAVPTATRRTNVVPVRNRGLFQPTGALRQQK
jgi:hypothetical protein